MTAAINQLFHSENAHGSRVIRSALEINLLEVLSRDQPTVVYADQIRVRGSISSAGHSITLYCRQLLVDNGATIDTSGSNGRTEPGFRKITPDVPGAHGESGSNGDDGSAAGAVTIIAKEIIGLLVIRAVGGNGGRGQDGGHGRDGQPGTNGVDAGRVDVKNSPIPNAADSRCDAGPCGRGGDAGPPGKSGDGGPGAVVLVKTFVPVATGHLTVKNVGGKPGETPSPGDRGLAGPPGTPGKQDIYYCTMHAEPNPREPRPREPNMQSDQESRTCPIIMPVECLTMENLVSPKNVSTPLTIRWECEYLKTLTGKGSGPRNHGSQASAVAAGAGADGNTDWLKRLSPADLAKSFQGTIIEMLCWATEDDYRQRGGILNQELGGRLEFLFEICNFDPSPDSLKQEILARVFNLKRKAELGLDLYGYSLEDAPLLSYETYSSHIAADLFAQLALIENAYNSALDRQLTTEKRREAIQRSIANAEMMGTLLAVTYQDCLRITQNLSSSVSVLEDQMKQSRAALEAHRDALDAAIKRCAKSDSCNLVSILTAAATIYATIQTGGAAFASMTGAMTNIGKYFVVHETLKDLWANKSVLERDLKTIGEGYGKFEDSVKKIGVEVQALNPNHKNLPSLQMQKDHFDSIAREFIEFPEAAAYRDTGYAFLRAVEGRNQAVIDFNAALLRLLDFQAKIFANQRIVETMRSKLTGLFNPEQSLVFALMTRIYRDSLSFAGVYVHAERKALGYMLNEPVRVSLSELNASTISFARQETTRAWANAKEAFKVKREIARGLLTIHLSDFSDGKSSNSWSLLKSEGKLMFALRRNHDNYLHRFKNLPGLRVTGLELQLEGVTLKPGNQLPSGEDQIFWDMSQDGHEQVFRADGMMVQFRHLPIKISGSSSISGGLPLIGQDFSEIGLYAGVSPFARWEIKFRDFDQFDFSGLKDANLKISGYFTQA